MTEVEMCGQYRIFEIQRLGPRRAVAALGERLPYSMRVNFEGAVVSRLPRVTQIVGSWNSLLHFVRMLMFSRSLRILRHTCTLQHPT